jgi:hypothetical protein
MLKRALPASQPARLQPRLDSACGVYLEELPTRRQVLRQCLPCLTSQSRFRWTAWSWRSTDHGSTQTYSPTRSSTQDRKCHPNPYWSLRANMLLAPSFEISPGEAELKRLYNEGSSPKPHHQQFSSFPSAFIIAADIELSVRKPTPLKCIQTDVSFPSSRATLRISKAPWRPLAPALIFPSAMVPSLFQPRTASPSHRLRPRWSLLLLGVRSQCSLRRLLGGCRRFCLHFPGIFRHLVVWLGFFRVACVNWKI